MELIIKIFKNSLKMCKKYIIGKPRIMGQAKRFLNEVRKCPIIGFSIYIIYKEGYIYSLDHEYCIYV